MSVASPAVPAEPTPSAYHPSSPSGTAITPPRRRRPTAAAARATVLRLPLDRRLAHPPTRKLGHNWIWICPLIVLIVGAFDLACTLGALHYGMLEELNPIAAHVIAAGGAMGLACYRAVITLLGCGLLVWGLRMYRDRRFSDASHGRVRRVVWAGQGILLVAHLGLVSWWTLWFLV